MVGSRQVALVTGANKGIGFEIARQLAAAGLHVLLGARDPELGQAAAGRLASEGHSVAFLHLDLESEEVIAGAVRVIAEEHGKLDVLVNNAAIGSPAGDGPPSVVSIQLVREIMETNFLGTLAVTQAMLPLLRKSASARIINASSPLGSLAIAGDPSSPFSKYQQIGYCASKAAVNLLTLQLNAELEGTNIVANSVVPGYVKTDLTGGTGDMTPEEGARTMVKYALIEDRSVVNRFVSPIGELPW